MNTACTKDLRALLDLRRLNDRLLRSRRILLLGSYGGRGLALVIRIKCSEKVGLWNTRPLLLDMNETGLGRLVFLMASMPWVRGHPISWPREMGGAKRPRLFLDLGQTSPGVGLMKTATHHFPCCRCIKLFSDFMRSGPDISNPPLVGRLTPVVVMTPSTPIFSPRREKRGSL